MLDYVRLGYNWQSAIGGALDLETREQKNKLKKSEHYNSHEKCSITLQKHQSSGTLDQYVYQTLLLQYVVCWTMLIH